MENTYGMIVKFETEYAELKKEMCRLMVDDGMFEHMEPEAMTTMFKLLGFVDLALKLATDQARTIYDINYKMDTLLSLKEKES